mmetsp:Transcript_10579/g.14696  ORF Transcript_10579/g.14696 Transcript_10579/m.14696 type:complete len:101 (-) Transcript_10579:660-962(-)
MHKCTKALQKVDIETQSLELRNALSRVHCEALAADKVPILSTMFCAIPYDTDATVTIGFTPDGVGNTDVSQTYRLSTSHVSPLGLTTPSLALLPILHVPI